MLVADGMDGYLHGQVAAARVQFIAATFRRQAGLWPILPVSAPRDHRRPPRNR
jgi:hypothetical protein